MLKNKNAYINIYKIDGTYLTSFFNLSNIRFTKIINSGVGELRFVLPISPESDEAPILLDFMNKVDLYIVDKESPSGQLVYSGFIDTVSPNYGFDKSITIRTLGYHSLFAEVPYKNGTDITLSFSSATPETVLTDIINKYSAVHTFSPISVSSSNLESGGETITTTFNSLSSMEAIMRVMESQRSGWFWYLGANNRFYFKQKSTTADHTFTYDKDIIPPIKTEKNITDLKNRVLFWNGTTTSRYYFDDTYISEYGERFIKITDSNYLTTQAQKVAENIVGSRQLPNQQISFRVLDSNSRPLSGYDIETIEIGDTFRIINLPNNFNFSENLQIKSITYGLHYVDIVGEDTRALTSRKLFNTEQQILKEQFEAGQPNYTAVDIS